MSESVVNGPHTTIILIGLCEVEGSVLGLIKRCAAGDGLRGGVYADVRWNKACNENSRTLSTSVARKYPPPPFLPFSATIAPGYIPNPPAPLTNPLTLIDGSNVSSTRAPDDNIRDDSIVIAPSTNLAIDPASASCVMRPTTTTSP